MAYVPMNEICTAIQTQIPAIIREWEELVLEPPWTSMSPDRRIDHLPQLIEGLAEASLGERPTFESQRRKVVAAAEHGRERREQGFEEHLILREYHLLRQAMWRFLIRTLGPSDRTTEAIMRIDVAITLATNASLWGYYRQEVEGKQDWEESIDRLASQSPFLQLDRSR